MEVPERIEEGEIEVFRCHAGYYHLKLGPFVFVFDETDFRSFATKVGDLAETRRDRGGRENSSFNPSPSGIDHVSVGLPSRI